jgi:serine/threonine-protein kinase
MVLEYLEGRDLDAELEERGTLPIPLAVLYVLQTCEAIAEAHERGIVHRDLKPSNLFLAERLDGSVAVKVLDFGISKSAAELQGRVTETGTLLGTPLYMSPEQVRDPRDADARSDIWALGVILHELVTGRLPFTGSSLPSLGAAIVSDPPIKLRDAATDAPEGLEKIVLRCLEKDPSRRYQSVADFARALAPFAPEEGAPYVRRIAALSGASMRSGRHRIDSLPALDAPTIDPDAVTVAASADRGVESRRDAGSLAASVSPPPRVVRRSRLVPIVALPVLVITGVGIWLAARSRTEPVQLPAEPSAAREPERADGRLPAKTEVVEPTPPVVSVAVPTEPSASAEPPVAAPARPAVRPRVPAPAKSAEPSPVPPKSTDDMLRYRK